MGVLLGFVALVVVVAIGAFVVMTQLAGEADERREIRKAPRMTVADAQAGVALRLVGAVRVGEPLTSPVSDRRCAWHRVVVCLGKDDEPLLDVSEARDFALEDATGRATIRATGAVAIVTSPMRTHFGDEAMPAGLVALLEQNDVTERGSPKNPLRVAEHVLEDGVQVVVYGFVDREADGVVADQPLRITDDPSLA